jgi:hypothetical protein
LTLRAPSLSTCTLPCAHKDTHRHTRRHTHRRERRQKTHGFEPHTHTHTHTHTRSRISAHSPLRVSSKHFPVRVFCNRTLPREKGDLAPSRERKETIRHQQDNTTSRHHHNTTTRQHTKKETNRHRILSPSPWAANKLAAFALLRPPPRHRHRGQGLTQVWTRTHARLDRDTRKYMDRDTRKYGAHASTEHCSLEYLL